MPEAGGPSRRRRPLRRWLRRILLGLAVVFVGLPLGLTLIYRFVPPPGTPLMVIRLFEGEGLDKEWQPLERISRHMPDAVIATEDNRFCLHIGIDLDAVRDAYEEYRRGRRLRGASTITMQTAKNLFLWPSRSYLRKALEAYLAVMLDALLPKRRIMELYLNVLETGPGLYGVEAAARHYFGKPAADLSRREAALIAAVLPNPRQRSPARPSGVVLRQAGTVGVRVRQLGPMLECVRE